MSFFPDVIVKEYVSSGAEVNNLKRTTGYLEDAFVAGAATCLICISHIKRNDGVSMTFSFYDITIFTKHLLDLELLRMLL